MERKVTRIDVLPQFDKSLPSVVQLRRVAAYVRVSTDKDEQLNSYENQLDYYPKLISSRPNWDRKISLVINTKCTTTICFIL